MGEKLKITVLGCGAAGPTMAADLASQGFDVNLYELPQFEKNIESIRERGGVEIYGELHGFFELNKVTTDIKEAVEDVDLIMITSLAKGHKPLFESCLPHLESGQTLLIYTPYFASLRFVNRLREKGMEDVVLGEVQILPYSCTRTGPASVFLRTTKSELQVAAIPAKDTNKIINILKTINPPPRYVPAKNVLETSLNNTNLPLINPIILLNIGYLEHTDGCALEFEYGLTPTVGKVIDALDKERIAIGKALEFDLRSFPEMMVKWYSRYGAKGETSYEVFRNLQTHRAEVSATLKKYIEKEENIPYGLVPLASLGDLLNIPTRAIDTIIQLAYLITGINYWDEGISVKELGLTGLTKREILNYVITGE